MARAAKPTGDTELKVGVGAVLIHGKDAIILDPLKAKAIVLAQGAERIAIVECDLGGVRTDVASAARRQASQETGIPYANICVAATHTHMAGCRAENIVPSIVAAIVEANRACKPAKIETSLSSACTVSFNRRYWMKDGTVMFNPMFLNPDIVRPAGPIDPELVFVLFRSARSDKATASLSNFALHCDTVKEYGALFQEGGAGSRNTVSADYPYWLEKNLKKEFGVGLASIFATGCCGNINHWDFSKPGPQSGHKTTTKRIGSELFAGARKARRTKEVPALGVRCRKMRIPLRLPSEKEVAWAKKFVKGKTTFKSEEPSQKKLFLNTVRARRVLHVHELSKQGTDLSLEVQAFRLSSDTAIVTLPGEMFVEHGLTIKNLSPFDNTLVVELANASCGYVPNRKAYSQGGYEVEQARLAPGGAEAMVQAAVDMLRELKTDVS